MQGTDIQKNQTNSVQEQPQKSVLGIVALSFLAASVGLLLFGFLLSKTNPLALFPIILGILIFPVSLILGIIAFCQKKKKKLIPAITVIANVAMVVGCIAFAGIWLKNADATNSVGDRDKQPASSFSNANKTNQNEASSEIDVNSDSFIDNLYFTFSGTPVKLGDPVSKFSSLGYTIDSLDMKKAVNSGSYTKISVSKGHNFATVYVKGTSGSDAPVSQGVICGFYLCEGNADIYAYKDIQAGQFFDAYCKKYSLPPLTSYEKNAEILTYSSQSTHTIFSLTVRESCIRNITLLAVLPKQEIT